MSSYPPNNLCVYIYAQAGCMGALIAARNQPTDPNEADYADAAERADFFAQEIDTIWGVGSYTNADLQQIQSAAASLWAGGRSPVPGAAGLTAAGYTGIAQALIAGVKAGTAQIVAEGINPNGCGGGGGGSGQTPYFATNPSPIGASVKPLFQTSVVVGASGEITWTAILSVSNIGGTAAAGDGIKFQPVLDGAALAPNTFSPLPLPGPDAATVGMVLAQATGLVPGSTHNVGIQAVDNNNGTLTLVVLAAGNAQVQSWT